jgi:hypothetical protein
MGLEFLPKVALSQQQRAQERPLHPGGTCAPAHVRGDVSSSSSPDTSVPSKIQPQTKLNLPGFSNGGGDNSYRGAVRSGIGRTEIGMVGQVEHFRTKL